MPILVTNVSNKFQMQSVTEFWLARTTNSSMFWHLAHSHRSVALKHLPLQEMEHPLRGGRAVELAPLQNNCNPSPKRHPKPSKPEEITDPLLKKPRISHSPKETAAQQSRGRMYKSGLKKKKMSQWHPGGAAKRVPLVLRQQSAGRKQLRSKDRKRPEATTEQPPSSAMLLRLEAGPKKEENIKNVRNWLCIERNLAKGAVTAYV